MTNSTFIRLAGPLQSWAALVVSGNFVRTEPAPTLSALRGLLAGALGAKRGEWPSWINDVQFTVREDKQARFADDFQTIGSREDEWNFRRRLAITQRMKAISVKQLAFKPAVGANAISRRTYLSDGEFIVRLTHEGHAEEIDQALSSPSFSLYLGRKAFPATFPFYLGTGPSDLLSVIPVVDPTAAAKGSLKSKSTVRIFETALGNGVSPAMEWVPAVANRTAWLQAVKSLNLQQRSTISA
ncbi:MAG: type I-E CRISPR-associated protein Cas5/CasD [Corynebacterium sp.]|nr:type I-E CRISPR-associated protein Cas5/CasD [Corynebacterium sp.]